MDDLEPTFSTRIIFVPLSAVAAAFPLSDTKQRAAATIGAMFDGRLPRKNFSQFWVSCGEKAKPFRHSHPPESVFVAKFCPNMNVFRRLCLAF
ncbi:MAG: hypothetical protein WCL14_09625 [Bacteroidota bacterium]